MKQTITKLLKKYSVQDIEKTLIHLFLDQHNLKSNNIFLNEYLDTFEMINQEDIDKFILKNNTKLTFENLERYFELLFPYPDKKVGGIFYTPSYIAEFIIKEVLNYDTNIKILDPSCGAGIFNYIALKEIKKGFLKNP